MKINVFTLGLVAVLQLGVVAATPAQQHPPTNNNNHLAQRGENPKYNFMRALEGRLSTDYWSCARCADEDCGSESCCSCDCCDCDDDDGGDDGDDDGDDGDDDGDDGDDDDIIKTKTG